MKFFPVLTLAIMISACGGDNSSSNEGPQQMPTIDSDLTFADYENQCGQGSPVEITTDTVIFDNNKQYKLQTSSSDATLEVQDSENSVCIDGDMAKLAVTGTKNGIYVKGDIEYLTINGNNHDIIIFGSVNSIEIEGDENAVQFNSVAVINEAGEYNLLYSSESN